MMKWRNAPILGGVFLFAAGTAAIGLALPQISYVRSDVALETVFREPVVRHVPTPEMVKAVYMTQCVVGTPSFRAELIDLIENTELNAVVIDIKDYSGGIAFPSTDPALLPYVSKKCGAYDMEEFVKTLHEKGIYVIGRITVFQDPLYTRAHPEFAVKKSSDREIVWKDHKGLSFIDVGAKPFWDYIVTLSKASYALGFDELNFDYIRFPSDGDMKDIAYTWIEGKTKQESLEEFFRYLHGQLAVIPVSTRPAEWVPVMSADLFGMTATNYDDLNIGQVLERALPYFDYIDPMVYPSHYPSGFNGYKNVNAHPYDIVHFSMAEAVRRTVATTTPIASFAYHRIGTSTPAVYAKPSYPSSKMRPWLQSFDYPIIYTAAMVQEQIRASTDAGLNSYLFWDPANKYRSLREVLTVE